MSGYGGPLQLRPRRLLRHRCVHGRLPDGGARRLAVDRDGPGRRARGRGRERHRLPVPALPAGGGLLRPRHVRVREMFLLVVQNLEVLHKTEGFNLPILPEYSWKMLQFEQGSPNYYWIPLGILVVALAITIAFVALAGRPVRPGSARRRGRGGLARDQCDALPADHGRAQLRPHRGRGGVLHAVLLLRRAGPGLRLRGLHRGDRAGRDRRASAPSGDRSRCRWSSVRSPR